MNRKTVPFFFLSMMAWAVMSAAPQCDPPESNRLQRDHAPTPFSAAEIRRNCDKGRWIEVKIWKEGEKETRQLTVFTHADDHKATITVQDLGEGGVPVGEKMTGTTRWTELQRHASFPENETEITCESLETPMGKLDCLLYTVRTTQEEETVVQCLWFAREMPGPPVLFIRKVDGRVVYRQEISARGMRKEPVE